MSYSPETSQPITIILFGGQGTSSSNSAEIRERASDDASTPTGSILLSECHRAFLDELSYLDQTIAEDIGLNALDFPTAHSLLTLLPDDRYLSNSIISGTTLFLLQSLRYLAFIESSSSSSSKGSPSFINLLTQGSTYGVGVLGFSSGILPATVGATSSNTLQYLNNAVQAFRVAFWIGVHTELFKSTQSFYAHDDVTSPLPWSVVFLGLGKDEAEQAISRFSNSVSVLQLVESNILLTFCLNSNQPERLSSLSLPS